MPGKAEASAAGSFWRGRGSCWAAWGEPGPASPHGQGPCCAPGNGQGPSCPRQLGWGLPAWELSRAPPSFLRCQCRDEVCVPRSCGSRTGFVQRAVLPPRQLFKWLLVPVSRSIRPALQNTDPVMEEPSSLGGMRRRAAAGAGVAAARARGKKGGDASQRQICWPVSQQAVAWLQRGRRQHLANRSRPAHVSSDTRVAAGAQRPSPQTPGLWRGLCFRQAARKQADGGREGVCRHSQVCLGSLARWGIDPQPHPSHRAPLRRAGPWQLAEPGGAGAEPGRARRSSRHHAEPAFSSLLMLHTWKLWGAKQEQNNFINKEVTGRCGKLG